MTRIVDLTPDLEPAYLVCLEEWSEEMREAGDRKARWLERMRDKGLLVKLALDDRDRPIGMIQAVPAVHAPIIGRELYFILCIWVHRHRGGVGDQQGHGVGTALLEAAEADARALGAKGMAAWGLRVPVFMRAAWFKKHGYTKADTKGLFMLLFKRFAPDVVPPFWLHNRRRPKDEPRKVVLTLCENGWCPAGNITFERARSVAAELGPGVEVREIDTCSDRAAMEAWGTDTALFIDDRPVFMGPPVKREKLERLLARRVRKKVPVPIVY